MKKGASKFQLCYSDLRQKFIKHEEEDNEAHRNSIMVNGYNTME